MPLQGQRIQKKVLLQVVQLRVVSGNGLAGTTYAMLDSGSEVTLVDPSLVSSLGLCGRPDRLVLSTVSNRNELQKGERVNLAVECLIDEQPQQLQLKEVGSGKELNILLRHQRIAVDKERWPHLHDVPFPGVERKKDLSHHRDKCSGSVCPPGGSSWKSKQPHRNPFLSWLCCRR